MGIHDRPYMQDGGSGGGPVYRSGLGSGLPKPGPAIKWLLIINVAVFLVQNAFQVGGGNLSSHFGCTLGGWWQLWRYITFQFLHGGIWHIGLNMLGLYFLGMPLEGKWGTRKFVRFYLSCGVTAGLAYVIAAAILQLDASIPLIGASGGVFGVILAAAVYFPHFKLLFMFFFPVPIRIAALIIFGGMGLFILHSAAQGVYSPGFWSHVAHLGGAVTGAVWVWIVPRFGQRVSFRREKSRQGAWQRKMSQRTAAQAEIDRILAKINDEGIASLTDKEKKTLQDATRAQKQQDRELYRP